MLCFSVGDVFIFLRVLAIKVLQFLHLVLAAEEDAGAFVDVLWHEVEDALLAVGGEPAGLFDNHGHGKTLVQNPELALFRLGVGGVGKDTAVEEGAVDVCHHGADVARTVGLAAVLRVLEGFKVLFARLVPVQTVSLVDRVDAPRFGNLHVWMGEDELPEGRVESEPIQTLAGGDDEVGRGGVHAVPGDNHLRAAAKDVAQTTGGAFLDPVDAKDGADRDPGVEVGGPVDRIAGHAVLAVDTLDYDGLFLLFRDDDRDTATGLHGVQEDVVRDDVEFLLLITRRIAASGESSETQQVGPSNVVCNDLAGELDGVQEDGKVTRGLGSMLLLFLQKVLCESVVVSLDVVGRRLVLLYFCHDCMCRVISVYKVSNAGNRFPVSQIRACRRYQGRTQSGSSR